MHKNVVKITRDTRDIVTDRQTERQTHSSQYFAITPMGEVTSYLSRAGQMPFLPPNQQCQSTKCN